MCRNLYINFSISEYSIALNGTVASHFEDLMLKESRAVKFLFVQK